MPSHRLTLLRYLEGVAALAIFTAITNTPAQAQGAPAGTSHTIEFDFPAQPLPDAVKALALATRTSILGEGGVLADRQAPALSGRYTLEQALSRMLAGTGLVAIRLGHGEAGFVIRQGVASGNAGGIAGQSAVVGVDESADRGAGEIGDLTAGDDRGILVTGTRIRGSEPSSLVIAMDRSSIEETGQFSMSDIARSIPQSFGGGTNPGIGFNVPGASGVDAGGSASVNLRGLGSEATLTLLNGHRAAYSGTRQGIDISTIPLGMVERIEVMPDGASALYGSDAVAGVVNVILRRHLDGLEARAQIGGTSDGGGFRQQYGVVGGTEWATGKFVAGYEYLSDSGIKSEQRDYTAVNPGLSISPRQHRHSVVLTGRQALGENLTVALDAMFNKRRYENIYPYNAAGDLEISRVERHAATTTIDLAPSVTLDLGPWQVALAGVYGNERMKVASDFYDRQTIFASQKVCYCNSLYSIEASGDGPVFALPGGLARAALGAGYRLNEFSARQATVANTSGSQESYYVFGEIDLPVVGPDLDLWGVRRLGLTGALRYERYPGVASVATPKLGVIYAPLTDLTLKANWGRSFRAPSLYQLHQVNVVSHYRAATLGGTSGTAFLISGGNPDLKPERATTWTTSLQFKPHRLPGLDLQVSYFAVRYVNRIVTPILYASQSLSNPLYADFVTRAPGEGAVADELANAAAYYNYTGSPYNPANVGALVYNTYANAGRQNIHGLDLLARYRHDFGDRGSLGVMVNAAWLDSEQRLTPGSATTPLAGTIFNPPHWRARGSLSWTAGQTIVNTTASYVGPVTDARYTPVARLGGMTTVDLTLRHGFERASGVLGGLSFTLTVQNLFNAKPDEIAVTNYTDTAYDMTNYSAIGRYIGVGVTKSW